MFAVIGIPAFGALGLLGGTIYGTVASETWQDPVTTFQPSVAELGLNQALPNYLAAFAQSHRYDVTPLITLPAESFRKGLAMPKPGQTVSRQCLKFRLSRLIWFLQSIW